MVLQSYKYATIYSQEGNVLANLVQMQERQVTEVDGIHHVITALLSKEESAKMTIWTTYLIRISSGKPGSYRLILREDERLPLRRHTFRSDTGS